MEPKATIHNGNSNFMRTTSLDYGQEYLISNAKTFKELGDNDIKLRYLEKSLKSKRKIEQKAKQACIDAENDVNADVNEKYKFDKNAIVGRKFPFTASQFKYPQDGKEQAKTFFRKYNDEYGSKKPNDLELPEKYFPINNTFTKEFNQLNFKNHSLNTAASRSKVHAALDSIV